ncbi:MAG: right-handed parallel beta-helix repeat-containing protein [Gammaproteobacteria bacterium]|nr:right-handed parallel beta-helix repeat-containing protein [Gammaproteobacteria bacterium]
MYKLGGCRESSPLALVLMFFVCFSYHAYANAVVAGAYYVSGNGSDSNDGLSRSEGGDGPWRTIQHAAQTLRAGETVYVREGTYSEYAPIQGSSKVWGVRPKNSGTANGYISYIAYPGERVILDTNFQSACFTLYGIKYVRIEGFEMRNCSGAGIWVRSGSSTENSHLVLNANHIHGINDSAGRNVAGIRMDHVGYSTISNNIIHNVRVGGEHNGNAAGVLSYRMHNVIIENNEFFDIFSGIFHKAPANEVRKSGIFRKNLFHDTSRAIYINTNETISGYHNGTEVNHNVVYESGRFIYDHTHQAKTQNTGLKVYNNTIIGTEFGIRGFDKVEFYNNILVDGAGVSTTYQSHVFSSPDTRKAPSILLSDHNLYSADFEARVGVYSGDEKKFSSLKSWQDSSSGGALYTIDVSASGADANSIIADPMFINKNLRDYRLQESSPARTMGVGGGAVGAYVNNNDIIGPVVSRFTDTPSLPVSPVLF